MNDACGKELKVGQTVMYAERFGASIRLNPRKVLGFTPKSVRLGEHQTHDWQGGCNIKTPEKVLVIIEEAPENVDN